MAPPAGDLEDAGQSFRFLIRDHDRKFNRLLDTVFEAAGTQIVTTPIQAPRANAIAERFVGSLRRKLLDRILIVNQRHAVQVLAEYERHLNEHRPHRALGQAAPLRPRCTVVSDSRCRVVNPAQHSFAGPPNRSTSPISATNTAASTGPIPGSA